MKIKIIFLFAIMVIVLAFVNNFSIKNEQILAKKPVTTPKTLKIGEISINIEVADTEEKRELGLSGKETLGEGEGLLFIFEKESYYGFWMKDMVFSIDIAWLNKNKKIIYIEKNVSPDSYPKIFVPDSPALYVLETGAGFFESNKIKIGDLVEF